MTSRPKNAKYSLQIQTLGGRRTIWDVELLSQLSQIDSAESRSRAAAIDRLRTKGCDYSFQDYDVLAGAHSLVTRNR
tara:strand:- start:10763 stop:10993 length:231 start_codon:yes stop_codon:yes gene_type:complete